MRHRVGLIAVLLAMVALGLFLLWPRRAGGGARAGRGRASRGAPGGRERARDLSEGHRTLRAISDRAGPTPGGNGGQGAGKGGPGSGESRGQGGGGRESA